MLEVWNVVEGLQGERHILGRGEIPNALVLCSGYGAYWINCPNDALKPKEELADESFSNEVNSDLWRVPKTSTWSPLKNRATPSDHKSWSYTFPNSTALSCILPCGIKALEGDYIRIVFAKIKLTQRKFLM